MSDKNNKNKKSKTAMILSVLQNKPMKLDEDESSGGTDTGPVCDTYANVIRDLAGAPDPEHLQKFEQEHIDVHKAQDAAKDSKSGKVKSKDFEQNQAKEVEQRSEQESQPTPSPQPFKGPSGPRR